MTELMEYTHGINTPVLRKYLEHVTAHPEEWDQEQWARRTPCGTSYCLAGHIAVGEGHNLDWGTWGGGDERAGASVDDGRPIQTIAAAALNVPTWTVNGYCSSGKLFSGNNTLHDLWRIASELTQGEIEIPPNVSEVV